MTSPYDDIINLPHSNPKRHARMPLSARAAQFAPFAALIGYDAAIKETARLTDQKLELDDTMKNALNEKLLLLQEQLAEKSKVAITYFVLDKKKSGGAYVTATGYIKKIQTFEHVVLFSDGSVIPMNDIVQIQGNIFNSLYLY
jgi:hypothetical protein